MELVAIITYDLPRSTIAAYVLTGTSTIEASSEEELEEIIEDIKTDYPTVKVLKRTVK